MIRSFSVIVPVLNKENEIVRTLESIEASIQYCAAQLSPETALEPEVIVVNEGSSDRTIERVSDYIQGKPHYQIVNHFKSLGIGPARNTGARISKGDILFFVDGDDLLFPEHIYICFAVLNHQPAVTQPGTIATLHLTTDRGSIELPLPTQPMGFVRTGVHMKDELHPHWKVAIENTIIQNLCIRRDCHEFVEGFPESPIYKQLKCCEDIAYDHWINRFFRQHRVPLETVEYIRYPGNALDRQLKKFQTPPDQYREEVPPECQALHKIRLKYEQDKLNYLLEKYKTYDKSDDFLSVLNWEQLAADYLAQKDYQTVLSFEPLGPGSSRPYAAQGKTVLAIAHNNLGSVLQQQRHLAAAATHFQQAIALKPAISATDLARIHYNVASVQREQQQYRAALDSLRQAIALDANLTEAQKLLPTVTAQAHLEERQYQFIPQPFLQDLVTWEQQLSTLTAPANRQCLEVGSADGQITCWLLDQVLQQPGDRLTCLDQFRYTSFPDIEQRFDANIARSSAPDKVRKLVGLPQITLRSLPAYSYDLVCLSSVPAASELLESLMLLWRLVKLQGLFVINYPNFLLEQPPAESMDIAIQAFLKIFDTQVKVHHSKNPLIVQVHQ